MKKVIMTHFSADELKDFIKEAIAESLPKPPPKRYKTLDAAKYLNVSTITLLSYREKGLITAKRIGNGFQWEQSELDRLINDVPRLKTRFVNQPC